MAVPTAPPLTDTERRSVHHFRTLRARIHDGPLYAVLDPSARVHKASNREVGSGFNAFEDQPTYTQRFRRARNTLPELRKRPFVKELFPAELWGVMGVASTETTEGGEKKRRRLEISTRTRLDRWMKDAEDEEEDAEEEGEEQKDDDQEEGEEGKEDDGAGGEGENVDPDQFDEDEEDENDDYNAEQYFSGGEDDDYGDDGGGGGGDDDY